MKRLFLILLIAMLNISVNQITYASEQKKDSLIPVCIKVNESFIETDAKPILDDGVTYVPVRAVSEALNCDEVLWEEDEKNVTIKDKSTVISLFVGKEEAYINGEKITVSGGAFIENDRTYVPIRFVSEAMDADVFWNGETFTVEILKEGVVVPEECIRKRTYTDNDLYWMARIINAESAGEPDEGKIAVGNVVINRVLSSDYPNTIYGVIFDRKYGVQFQPVANGTVFNQPHSSCVVAAKRVLEGENVAGKSLFFLNENIAENFWIVNNRTYLKTIGKHSFYL